MEKVLFVAYQFPPRGGPGVQRSVALVKHLRSFGYDPVVLTIKAEDVVKGGHTVDESLLSQLPSDLEIVRTPSMEPVDAVRSLMKWRLFRLAWYFNYRKYWEWSAMWPESVKSVALDLIAKHKIRLVYTTSGPFSSMIVGRYLQKETGVKWVADLRDPFTDAYAWQFPSKIHWNRMRKWEEEMFALPDRLVVNTPEVKSLYLRRKLTDPNKIQVITNGY